MGGLDTHQALKTTLFQRTLGVFEGRQLSVETLKVNHFPLKEMRTGLLWSHLLKSTELSWPCRLNMTRNSPTVESLSSFSISFNGKKADIIRNSILTHHPNLGLTNIFDVSPQSVSGFVMAFWFAVCQHYSRE